MSPSDGEREAGAPAVPPSAHPAAPAEIRTYRVSRVSSVDVLDEDCRRPVGFDLAAFWEASKARFVERLPRYPVVVRATPASLDALRSTGFWSRLERIDPPDERGWARVEIRFERVEDAVVCLLGLGPGVEAIEPPDLRSEIRLRAERTAALYRDGADTGACDRPGNRCAGRADVLSSAAGGPASPALAPASEPYLSTTRTA